MATLVDKTDAYVPVFAKVPRDPDLISYVTTVPLIIEPIQLVRHTTP